MHFRLLFSFVCLPLTLISAGRGSGNGPVLFLQEHAEECAPLEEFAAPWLHRELIRQSFLWAARGEFGLDVVDGGLRKAPPAAADRCEYRVLAAMNEREEGAPLHYRIVEASGDELGKTVFDEVTPLLYCYEAFVERMERLSREEFPAILRQRGAAPVSGAIHVEPDDEQLASLAAGIERFDEVSQFFGLRRIHQALEVSPDHPELLGLASRAYANLGQLTRYHWSPSHKIFQARALLLAERRVALEGATPASLGHRAYVRALVGRHKPALDDLEGSRAQGFGTSWLSLTERFLHFDTDALLAAAQSTDQEHVDLAAMLAVMTVEFSPQSSVIFPVGEESLDLNPFNFRIHSVLLRAAGVRPGHRATVAAPAEWLRCWTARLQEAENLPPAVFELLARAPGSLEWEEARMRALGRTRAEVERELWEDVTRAWPSANTLPKVEREYFEKLAAEPDAPAVLRYWLGLPLNLPEPTVWWEIPELARALREAGKEGEPRWAALATLLEDGYFALAMHRTLFQVKMLAVSISDEQKKLFLHQLEGHPLIDLFPPLFAAGDNDRTGMIEKFQKWSPRNLTLSMVPVTHSYTRRRTLGYQGMTWGRVLTHTVRQSDRVYDDLMEGSRIVVTRLKPDYLRPLLALSPYDGTTAARVLRFVPEERERIMRDWTDGGGAVPALAVELGRYFSREKEHDKAIAIFQRVVDSGGGWTAYNELSRAYLAAGQEDKWLETLERFILQEPDYGLNHAGAKRDIARYFLRRGKVELAVPWAEEAAQSWSAWGMQMAADCHYADGNLAESLLWVERRERRYPSATAPGLRPYLWAVKSGLRGEELKRFGASVREKIADFDPGLAFSCASAGAFYYLEGDKTGAFDAFDKAFRLDRRTPITGLFAALVADELGDAARRDTILQMIASVSPKRYSNRDMSDRVIELAKRFQTVLASGPVEFDQEDWQGLAVAKGEANKVALACIAGWFLRGRKMEEEATVFYKIGLVPENGGTYAGAILHAALRELGVDSQLALREQLGAEPIATDTSDLQEESI